MKKSFRHNIKKILKSNRAGLGFLSFKDNILRHLDLLYSKIRTIFGKVEVIYLDVTAACNLKCISCLTDAGKPKCNELSLEEKKSVIRQAREMGARKIALSGSGEPLVYKDIFKLMDYIKQLGMSIVLFTNGILIDREVARFLISRNVSVFFKFWSLNPAIVDSLSGIKNSYKWVNYSYGNNGSSRSLKIPSGLKYLLQEAKTQSKEYLVNIEVLITKVNCSTIPEVIKFSSDINIGLWLETVLWSGRAIGNYDSLCLTRDDYKCLYNKLVGILGEKYFNYHRNQKCVLEKSPIIAANGEIGFCSSREARVGNVRDESLRDLFSKAIRHKRREDGLIPKYFKKSRYFRTCTARAYHQFKQGLACDY